MEECPTLLMLETILAAEKDKRRATLKWQPSKRAFPYALKIDKRGEGSTFSGGHEGGDLEISSPTLISRTTSWTSPVPSPHVYKSWKKERSLHKKLSKKHEGNDNGGGDDEFEISSPVLISRTMSHASILSPRFSRNASFLKNHVWKGDDNGMDVELPDCSSETQPSFWKNSMDENHHDDENHQLSRTMSRTSRRTSSTGGMPTPIVYTQSASRRRQHMIERKLECTLEELCFGCVRKISIIRDAISANGLPVQEEDTLTIKVESGWRKGTKVIFEGKGDERDIALVIDEKTHPIFDQEGDDLELGVEVPLLQALTGCTICVPLLGGEMDVTVDEIIYPGYEMIIEGQGMPKAMEQGNRGDLKLKFLVEFPNNLSDEQRKGVARILEEQY